MELERREDRPARESSPAAVFACPTHPGATGPSGDPCPVCGSPFEPATIQELLAVPVSAVVHSGARTVVYIARDAETFEGVEVTLGPRAGEWYPVRNGLVAGDRVVTAGAFLVDAENRLNPAAGVVYFGASGGDEKK